MGDATETNVAGSTGRVANEATAAALIGARLRNPDGHVIGRLTAVIHRSDGIDLLITSRRWLRTRTIRVAAMDVRIDINGVIEFLEESRSRDGSGGTTK